MKKDDQECLTSLKLALWIFASFSPIGKKKLMGTSAKSLRSYVYTQTHTHTHTEKYTDSFCTFSMKGFSQVAVIRGRDRARVSEDPQLAFRQWGAIWKPSPHVEPPLWYCLPTDWRHRGVFNEHCSPAGCLKVGLSIHSSLMTLCITGRLLTARPEPERREQSLQIGYVLKIDS